MQVAERRKADADGLVEEVRVREGAGSLGHAARGAHGRRVLVMSCKQLGPGN